MKHQALFSLRDKCKTRMVVQEQLVEPAVCFSDLCEQLIPHLLDSRQTTSLYSGLFFKKIYAK